LATFGLSDLTDSKVLLGCRYFREHTSSELSIYRVQVGRLRSTHEVNLLAPPAFLGSSCLPSQHTHTWRLGHTSAAIATFHESLESIFNVALPPWHAEAQRCFTIQQCNEAIGLLRYTGPHAPPTEVLLMSGILFITFEYLDNRCENGMDLLRGGLEIFRQSRSSALSKPKPSSEVDLVEDHLAPALGRCSLLVLGDPELEDASLRDCQGGENRQPANLHRLSHASSSNLSKQGSLLSTARSHIYIVGCSCSCIEC
jgi:hypothetical protein